jgi:hypothetical protein
MPGVDERTDEEGANAEVLWSVDGDVGYVFVTEVSEAVAVGVEEVIEVGRVEVVIDVVMVEEVRTLLVGVVVVSVTAIAAFDDSPAILNIRIFGSSEVDTGRSKGFLCRDSITFKKFSLFEVDPIIVGVLGDCYERGPCTSLVENHALVERLVQLWGVMVSTTMSGAGVFD